MSSCRLTKANNESEDIGSHGAFSFDLLCGDSASTFKCATTCRVSLWVGHQRNRSDAPHKSVWLSSQAGKCTGGYHDLAQEQAHEIYYQGTKHAHFYTQTHKCERTHTQTYTQESCGRIHTKARIFQKNHTCTKESTSRAHACMSAHIHEYTCRSMHTHTHADLDFAKTLEKTISWCRHVSQT